MHNRIRFVFLLPLLFLALGFLPAGTAALQGTVVDASTGKKLNGATVELVKAGTVIATTHSDAQGAYQMKNLVAGYNAVRVTMANYKTSTIGIALTDGKTTTQNFSLTSTSAMVQNVSDSTRVVNVVTLKKEDAKISNGTVTTTVTGGTPAYTSPKPVADGASYSYNKVKRRDVGAKSADAANNAYAPIESEAYYAPPAPVTTYNAMSSTVVTTQSVANDPVSGNESYDRITDNRFRPVQSEPLSTFSIDVDRASYSNVRRYLNDNMLPPTDAVRIEEMVNYFTYDYPQPTGNDPFSINTELADCPWSKGHQLVQIGLQGKDMDAALLPPSNLVFLIDVSGSMESANKLPLVKTALNILIDRLRPQDKVTIVVYAGAAGEVLPPTPGSNKQAMRDAISRLNAGGSTAGGAGIELAYKRAKENYIEQGNNRVILATDGDFNVGVSSDAELEKLIEEKRKGGVFLTTLGFGMGNYKDSKMETLADKGNGNYQYIDNALEAEKVFVKEFGGTLFTIAKDVKLQIEFNPSQVKAYRLIGYENRMLNKEDFNDDKKDAGELGCGHTVTALYEVIPASSTESIPGYDSLKYQTTTQTTAAAAGGDLMTVKFRYKEPTDSVSKLIVHPLQGKTKSFDAASENLRFASSVAEFGMLLRNSPYKGNSSFEHVEKAATAAKGKDTDGYRAEFLKLIKTAASLSKSTDSASTGGTGTK